jgi:hypothetical protein
MSFTFSIVFLSRPLGSAVLDIMEIKSVVTTLVIALLTMVFHAGIGFPAQLCYWDCSFIINVVPVWSELVLWRMGYY